MKHITRIFIVANMLAVMSFAPNGHPSKTSTVAGTYGSYCDSETVSSASEIMLTLRDDKTFQYVDHSDPDGKISITGKWTLDQGEIFLTEYASGVRIPKIWKTEKEGQCLKARKGTMFVRLCRQG